MQDLKQKNQVVRVHRKYTIPQEKQTVRGILEITSKGFGFVITQDDQSDIFIPKRFLNGSLHGDEVIVSIVSSSTNSKKREGRILKSIHKPGSDLLLGMVKSKSRGPLRLDPLWQNSPYAIFLEKDARLKPNRNQIVQAKILRKNDRRRSFFAKVIEIIGEKSDPSIDTTLVLLHQNIDSEFSSKVKEQAKRISAMGVEAPNDSRVDLRHLPFVTIDGEDAKDFDDAVCMDETGAIWVAVADVAHYVEVQSPIDICAAERGNSFYFPDRVVPMLPEELSNDLCSLRPNVDRQAMVVKMIFQGAEVVSSKIYNALICSKARLTYVEVDEMLNAKKAIDIEAKLFEMLQKLRAHTVRLFEHRLTQGSVDFDFHEMKISIGKDGSIREFYLRKRTPSQNLIEELMLITNELVAKTLNGAGYPVVFRAHDGPKLENLLELVKTLQYHKLIPEKWPIPEDERELIKGIQNELQKSEKYDYFSTLILRSMSQAHYTPEHKQHYALAFETYSHFTSPIRRYADLINHRIAKAYLKKIPPKGFSCFPRSFDSLSNLSLHISLQERIAQKAERSIAKIKGIRWYEDKIGQECNARVSGVTSKGLYLEMEPHKIEGFASNLQGFFQGLYYDDRYNCYVNARKGIRVTLGDSVRVKVVLADVVTKRLDLAILP